MNAVVARIGILRAIFCVLLTALVCSPGCAQAATYSYATSASAAIPDGQASCASTAIVQVSVTDSFPIGDINAGFIISHARRGDLEISLTSPQGTTVSLISGFGSNSDNYNLMLDDEASTAIDHIFHNTAAAFPEYTHNPFSGTLSDFDGEEALGTWTLTVCDDRSAQTGTVLWFQIDLEPSPLLVTSTADTNTVGTLRYAIDYANANADEDDIIFDIAGAGPHAITLGSALPTITDDEVSIDGTTQSGAGCGQLTTGTQHTLQIELRGSGVNADALEVLADNITIRGLSITGFDGAAVQQGAGTDNINVTCNYMGVRADGVTKSANAAGAGYTAALRMLGTNVTIDNNVVSGSDVDAGDEGLQFLNVTGGTVTGNLFGLAADGSTVVGNLTEGVVIGGTSTGIVIGGTTAQTRNIVSGNGSFGIHVGGSTGTVQIIGNYIGTDRTGLLDRGNIGDGILLSGSNGTTIGGASAGQGNVISGNNGRGVILKSSVTGATIIGNYIGTDATGVAALGNSGNGIQADGASNINIGNGTASGRNIISGNVSNGIYLNAAATVSILGNYIGIGADGTADLGNGGIGLSSINTDDLTLGNGTASGRNVVTANDTRTILLQDGNTITIAGNYLGVDATGNTSILTASAQSNEGADDGIAFNGSTFSNVVITENVFGGFRGQAIEIGGGATTTGLTIQGNHIGVGADGTTTLPVGKAATGAIIFSSGHSVSGLLIGGTGAGEGNIIANSRANGIWVRDVAGTVTGSIIGNTIHSNTDHGIVIAQTGSSIAVYANRIYGNGGLGIDLEDDSLVAPNDPGDTDTGPNGLMNFPVLNQITADGSTSVGYDFDIDVSNMGLVGHRIEFFSNSAADPSGHGEGEIFLGHVDITSHGDTNHTGSFTAASPVSPGDIITATATSWSGFFFQETSEFSAAITAFTANPAVLAAAKTVSVVDDGLVNGDDTAAIPGATLRYVITVQNTGAGAADADATVIVDSIPGNGALKVTDFGGIGGTGPVNFVDGSPSSGLSYSFVSLASGADDLDFSDDNAASWTYTPVDAGDGTDPNVTHIRITPSGSFNPNAGTPPIAGLRYDVLLF